jgi:TonB family protein
MTKKAAAISIGIHLAAFGILFSALKHSESLQTENTEDLDVSWGHKTVRQKTITAPLDSGVAAQQTLPGTTTQEVATQPEQNAGGSNSPLSITDPYYSRVRSQIQSKIQYPGDLIRRRITGQVVLKLLVVADGSLNQLDIEKSRGHEELDQLALKAVRAAAPFGSFPEDSKHFGRQIVLPVDFKR